MVFEKVRRQVQRLKGGLKIKYSDGREMKFTDIAEQVDLAVSACETVKRIN